MSRTLRSTALIAGLAAGTLLAIAGSAEAFTFKTNATGAGWNDTTSDIWLQSIELEDGTVIDKFSLVSGYGVVKNDKHTGGNSGAASTDIGDTATTGTKIEAPNGEQLVGNLNNLNLNNIIDTEDSGSFELDFYFDNAVDNLLIWERGINSALEVWALNADGETVGDAVTVDFRQLKKQYDVAAGYSINTKEIGGAQQVGSWGLTMADLGVEDVAIYGFRFSSEKGFNGPDWKIAGTNATREGGPVDVPEPTMMLGLLTVGALGFVARKRG
ncbi:MAG: PEP-CTERM sorting domain-containing protein [Spirulinaceae cyanobacterium RM2_2_10]|nr:PEP-CTERM sorting domain-containing protein [Spirulinaceae cyanobacterium SM2_1_0]NJO19811.1 PEP-CTERM sorting domain-containing protein [Spirulinaceae cyanobacterium RM2_2_10]